MVCWYILARLAQSTPTFIKFMPYLWALHSMQTFLSLVLLPILSGLTQTMTDGKGNGKDVGFCGAVVDSKAFPGAVSARVQNVDDIGTFWL